MRTLNVILSLCMTILLLAPAASAHGYLVNVGIGGWSHGVGYNLAGGAGDTVDLGLWNTQCGDEDDVADVGVFNTEGCAAGAVSCRSEEGTHDDLVGTLEDFILMTLASKGIFVMPTATEEPHRSHCSDDGDTADVGLGNTEGIGGAGVPGQDYEVQRRCDEARAADTQPTDYTLYGGDYGDGADVGLINRENCDDDDSGDAGVINCEASDMDDGVDGGVLNRESIRDGSDTFDLGVQNVETGDGAPTPDDNGLNIGLAIALPVQVGCGFLRVSNPIPEGLLPDLPPV